MAEDQIRYDVLTQEALRGVVKTVLERIANSGLPGDHHLYIAFETRALGVSISERLRDQYPEEMTIVLQHQFWDLEVSDDRFEVKLSFNNIPERLVVPFLAIKAFYDPSVQFGLQFGNQGAANDADRGLGELPGLTDESDDAPGVPAVADGTGGQSGADAGAASAGSVDNDVQDGPVADVVELDAFRKKS
ncbi:MAG: ClpXP protease specificity-enhancing factor SspB [Pseudomonadota bacterium]